MDEGIQPVKHQMAEWCLFQKPERCPMPHRVRCFPEPGEPGFIWSWSTQVLQET